MKCNLPRSYQSLPQREKDAITEVLSEQLNEAINKEEAELQEIWIKLACINLHETFGFGEDRLNRFIAAWNRMYRKNERTGSKSAQTAWLNEEMAKCFPKYGFPQHRIDRLKEKV